MRINEGNRTVIIKAADDHSNAIATLQSLLKHPAATPAIRKKIESKIRNVRAGHSGEAQAAYEINFHYGDNSNWAVIHDLRVEHKDLSAQIDHILINRLMYIWVCESKHFANGISINEQGEFRAFSDGKPYGISSPIEQNKKHITMLQRIFDSGLVEIPTRLGFSIKPKFHSRILVSQNALIERPKTLPEIEMIIKNDQLRNSIDIEGEATKATDISRVIGEQTLHTFARAITALHKPIKYNWAGMFGLSSDPQAEPIDLPKSATSRTASAVSCHACATSISNAVARFCRMNKQRFGGNLYCMTCQPKITTPSNSAA